MAQPASRYGPWVLCLTLIVAAGGVLGYWAMRPLSRDRLRPQTTGITIDVNTADAQTLALLPGVGPTVGQHMVEHREAHGPFRDAQDLEAVRMIGPVTRQAMEPYIRFGSPEQPAANTAATPRPPRPHRHSVRR